LIHLVEKEEKPLEIKLEQSCSANCPGEPLSYSLIVPDEAELPDTPV